jgi:hypothetical protein
VRSLFSINNRVGEEFVFQTNSSTGTTFDPVVAMSGSKRASWDLGDGSSYVAGNSISHTYGDGSVKIAKIRTNKLSDITSINMIDDSVVGKINLSGFTNCTQFEFNANSNLTGVTLPNTQANVSALKFFACNLYGNLDISVMPNIGGVLFISANPNLTGLTIPSASTQVFNEFRVVACNITGRLDLSGYTNLGGIINVQNNANLTGITFPVSTQNINNFYIGGSNNISHDLIISGLTGLGGQITIDSIDSQNILFPSSSNNITSFNLNTCPFITSVDLTSLSGFGGSISIQGNTGVTSYNFPPSGGITYLGINSNTSITSLTLTALTLQSGSVLLSDNTNLSTITLPSAYSGPITSWNFDNCALTTGTVNYILDFIDVKGWTGGTLTIIGGTNSAPDTTTGGYDGVAAKSNLTGKSWSVSTI